MTKPVSFLGVALDRIKEFPQGARREAGFQIDKVQQGLMPDDWKPMPTIGKGVAEIRIRDSAGAFRVMYIATLPEALRGTAEIPEIVDVWLDHLKSAFSHF